MISFFRRIFFSRNFAILALLIVAIGSVTVGLASAPRLHEATPWLLNAALVSTLLGWLLAASRLPGAIGLPLGVILGAAWAVITGGRLGVTLVNWLSKLPPLLMEIIRYWCWHEVTPDWQPLAIAGQLLATDAGEVWQRLINWGVGIWQRQPATDTLPLAIFWMWVLWSLAFWAGWTIWRTHNPLIALGPAVGLLAALLNYQGLEAHTLVIPLGAAMLLMALMRYDLREHRWQQQHIDFAEGIPIDLMLTAGALMTGLLVVGVLAPNFSVQAVINFTRQFSQPANADAAPMGESFGLQAKPPPVTARKVRPAGLFNVHNLAGRPDLTTDIVMTVEVSQPYYSASPSSMPTLYEIPTAPRYYWRMLTYDRYNGSGWSSSRAKNVSYAAQAVIFAETPLFHQIIRQKVTPVQELGGVLFATGQLQSANHPYDVVWRQPPGTFTLADPFGALIADGEYEVTSYLPKVTAAQLRAAPATYPAEIGQRYLQLPEDLPIRVRELALKLTTGQPTAYDKASAIEQFLRTIPYSLDIAGTPQGRDSVDYFLFDLQTGFCDYYASAMTVLARSSGLPARLVLGYASGSFDNIRGRYVVREVDAHAWVEIYFPDIGWVEFEPTAAQPAIYRPDGRPVTLPSVELPQPEIHPTPSLATRLQGYAILALISLSCLGALVVQGAFVARAVELWWWSRQPPKQTIVAIYAKMRRNGEGVLGPLPEGDTPDEFARRLQIGLANITQAHPRRGFRPFISAFVKRNLANPSLPVFQPSWLVRRLAPAEAEIDQLTRAYTHAVYSEHPPTSEMQTAVLQTWRKLRGRLWLARWLRTKRRENA